MSIQSNNLRELCLIWLKLKVFPLWSTTGVDSSTGRFVESLNFERKALQTPLRCLVQARQIYSFAEGCRLGSINKDIAHRILDESTQAFIRGYSLPNGAFVHSIDQNGHLNKDLDLYSQSFAIFALAHAYDILRKEEFKKAALKVVEYLKSERKNRAGGYTEIKGGKTLYQSNPHMHLFEAAISWAKVDQDPIWKSLAGEISQLCQTKFIEGVTGLLTEHFNENWEPIREKGQFIFEPGHHFEWSWLFIHYERITGEDCKKVAQSLFKTAQQYGLNPDQTLAYDEIWSNGQPHKKSSRFWPQTERIKAAIVLREFEVADVAMAALMKHYLLMEDGLWKDTFLEDGTFADIPAKASSLYHIINAMSEYINSRH